MSVRKEKNIERNSNDDPSKHRQEKNIHKSLAGIVLYYLQLLHELGGVLSDLGHITGLAHKGGGDVVDVVLDAPAVPEEVK